MARFARNEIISLTGASPRYELGESYGPNLSLAELLATFGKPELAGLELGYGVPEGDLRLRRLIADVHGVGPDEVVVTVGGSHALFLLAFILCAPGDEAVTTAPLFPQARNALEAVGARVQVAPASFRQGYKPALDDFVALLSPRTKLVSVASPQNPSGVALEPGWLRELAALMARVCPDAYLLVDETYREATYGADPVAPSAAALGPKSVAVASLSKAHGAPGLRLGWAVTSDPNLREQLVLGKFNTVISGSPLDEALALALLSRRESILSARRTQLADRLSRTADWVAAKREFIEWVRPDAGALCCIRLRPERFDDAAIARFNAELTKEKVRLANGAWFGDENRVFRLGFGLLAVAELEAALAGLGAALVRASG